VILEKLNWFPLCFAKGKRKKIKDLIEALHNNKNKSLLVNEYLKERERLLKTPYSDSCEYPPWNNAAFNCYLKLRSFEKYNENEEFETHLYKLQFYYNPDLN